MNYIKITPMDIANGPGIRTTLWVAGCEHHCPGCQNPDTWDSKAGKIFDEDAMYLIESQLEQPWCAGLTISGGDPLFPTNQNTIAKIVAYFKEYYPDKTIWVWTGSPWEDIVKNAFLKQYFLPYIDVLVDGPFIQSQRDITLEWRGSSNQRIIDVRQSLRKNRIILWKDDQYK